MDIQDYFGGIDIYLFDQIQKGRITKEMKILDAGCGNGRNLIYLMREGYQVFGMDHSKTYVDNVRFMAKQLTDDLPDENFRLESFEKLSFDDGQFDFVISSAVLHFAKSDEEFLSWLKELWRVLKVGGIFFARLASKESIEDKVEEVSGRRYHLPDGSDRYLVDNKLLGNLTRELSAELIEPLKTTNVQDMRAMTTWVVRKLDKMSSSDGLNESRGIKLFRE